MPKITVLPAGIEFTAVDGETIMEAARAAGYWWPTSCGGHGECSTCAGEVLSGAENLSAMGRWEEANLVRQRGRAALSTALRLCCQARVHGDVEVKRAGVKPW